MYCCVSDKVTFVFYRFFLCPSFQKLIKIVLFSIFLLDLTNWIANLTRLRAEIISKLIISQNDIILHVPYIIARELFDFNVSLYYTVSCPCVPLKKIIISLVLKANCT